ncbi:hypothetical protein FRB97_007190 [Tulasnella sp. 331]|nr:hypothetical protein FRB97_007190 [Tulasnella sp. 331]
MLVAIFFLKETLPSKVSTLKDKIVGENTIKQYTATTETAAVKEPVYTAKQILSIPQIRSLMGVSFLLSFLHISWDAVFVLFAYTRSPLGGLQRTPAEIASFLSTTGVLGMLLSIVAFPALQQRFDTLPLYRACMALWPVVFILFSATSFIARWTVGSETGAGVSVMAIIWILVSMILILGRIATMGFAADMLLIKKAAPNQRSLGATFGLAQMTGSFARALGPAFVNSLFAFSIDHQILKGQFVWLVMFTIGVGGFMATRRLR